MPRITKAMHEDVIAERDQLEIAYQELQREYNQFLSTSVDEQVLALQSQVSALRISNDNLTNVAAELEDRNKRMQKKFAMIKRAAQAEDVARVLELV